MKAARISSSMVLCVLATFANTTLCRRATSDGTSSRRRTADLLRSFASLLQQKSNRTTTTTSKQHLRHTSSTDNHNNSSNQQEYDYHFLVIGAGSGGIAAARRAASYSKNQQPHMRVAIAEAGRLGGTCVNLGCVPKKVMWNAASIAEAVHDMEHFGFGGPLEHVTFDWNVLKEARDRYIARLNRIYAQNLVTSGVTQLKGWASLVGPHTVQIVSGASAISDNDDDVNDQDSGNTTTTTVTAQHILIATGCQPILPPGEGIAEHCITSDHFFDLNVMPRKAVVVGAGYIAVELAGVLQALGTDTKLVLRKHKALRQFDDLLSDTLDEEMQRQGIEIYRNTDGLEKVVLADNSRDSDNDSGSGPQQQLKTVHLKNGQTIEGVDTVLVAPGRGPLTASLGLDRAGVRRDDHGYIVANEYSETNVPGVYAIGDVVAGQVELTPTAIAAGRRLADRLFGGTGMEDAKVSYDLVPTVVFCTCCGVGCVKICVCVCVSCGASIGRLALTPSSMPA